MLEGTGSLLAVTDDGDSLVDSLREKNIEACIIGRVTDDNDKLILSGEDERRFLNMVSGDEIYKLERFR
jgi:hydrogenase maturation factor